MSFNTHSLRSNLYLACVPEMIEVQDHVITNTTSEVTEYCSNDVSLRMDDTWQMMCSRVDWALSKEVEQ